MKANNKRSLSYSVAVRYFGSLLMFATLFLSAGMFLLKQHKETLIIAKLYEVFFNFISGFFIAMIGLGIFGSITLYLLVRKHAEVPLREIEDYLNVLTKRAVPLERLKTSAPAGPIQRIARTVDILVAFWKVENKQRLEGQGKPLPIYVNKNSSEKERVLEKTA